MSLPIQTLEDVTYARRAENVLMVRKGSLATDWKDCSPKIDYSCKYGMWRFGLAHNVSARTASQWWTYCWQGVSTLLSSLLTTSSSSYSFYSHFSRKLAFTLGGFFCSIFVFIYVMCRNSNKHFPIMKFWASYPFCLFSSDMVVGYNNKEDLVTPPVQWHCNLVFSEINFLSYLFILTEVGSILRGFQNWPSCWKLMLQCNSSSRSSLTGFMTMREI